MMEEEIKLEVGKTLKLDITSYTHEGLGVGKYSGKNLDLNLENYPFFIFGAILGDTVLAEITSLNKSYGYATIVKTIEANNRDSRVTPICPAYKLCGGCNIMHMSYKEQLHFKEEMVKSTIKKFSGVNEFKQLPIIPSQNIYYYRNKVQVPVISFLNKTKCGFYERSSHKVVPLDKCFIQTEKSTNLVNFVKNIFVELGVKGYNELYDNGNLKHILIRKNHDESEMMVVAVVKDLSFLNEEFKERLIDKIIKRYPEVVSISINYNPKNTNTILGNTSITIYGNNYITDTLCGMKFKIGIESFYQINHDQTEILYNTAIKIADLNKDDIVIDAYSGIGTIGLIISKAVKEVYSVEIVKEAIDNAEENKKMNNVKNIHFVCNKAEDQIALWLNEGIKVSTIIVDPPRKGCDEKLLNSIIEHKINKLIYISCNPSTLARDIGVLSKNNYELKIVQPVDLFPHTNHIECISSLVLRNISS